MAVLKWALPLDFSSAPFSYSTLCPVLSKQISLQRRDRLLTWPETTFLFGGLLSSSINVMVILPHKHKNDCAGWQTMEHVSQSSVWEGSQRYNIELWICTMFLRKLLCYIFFLTETTLQISAMWQGTNKSCLFCFSHCSLVALGLEKTSHLRDLPIL